MRVATASLLGLALLFAVAEVRAGMKEDTRCVICTCQNEAVICLQGFGEEIGEQGPCAGPCSQNEGFQSIKIVESACEDLPTCDHAYAPAASPLWLTGGAVALLLIGGATVRRMSARDLAA
jgi:hypothetical protein